jgi:hypothetical protein
MTRPGRIAVSVIFVLALMVCGLVAGTWIGGRFFVPPGSGLAGPGIALGYGVIGAGTAGIVSVIAAYFLPPKLLFGVALPVIVVGGALTVVIIIAVLKSRAETQASLEEAYAKMNKFRATLVYREPGDAPFARMEIDWATRRYSVVGGTTDGLTCRGRVRGEDAVAFLGALRAVEGITLNDPFPCAGTLGDVERELEWTIPEVKPPDSGGKHAITAACAAQFPALDQPFAAAADIVARGDHERDCG